MEQRIQLSDHFGFGRLIRFTIPSILMMIFTSIYGVVDGYFVSNFVGKTPFAAVNFIMPFLMVVGAMGFMFGTGGSALIARIMGEGRREKAQEIFSLLIAATFVSGLVIAVISILFLPQIAAFLGAKGEMLADCIRYGRIILVALPFLMLQYAFGSLSVTAEKPKLGFPVPIRVWLREEKYYDHFGCAQYDGRCSVHGSVPLGNCRSGDGDCDGTDHRRNDTAGLFPAEEQQQPAPSQTKVGWRSAQTCLHQRCIGIDEQYFHVHCRHAV